MYLIGKWEKIKKKKLFKNLMYTCWLLVVFFIIDCYELLCLIIGTLISFQNYKNAIAKTIASESEKKSSLLALNGIKKEAEFGIRTVLEELDAEVEYLNASANLIKSEAEKVYNLLSI